MTERAAAAQADQALRAILFQALSEPVGLLIRTNSPERARQQFYQARRGFPDLAQLSFRASPFPDGELVIIRNDPAPPVAQTPEDLGL